MTRNAELRALLLDLLRWVHTEEMNKAYRARIDALCPEESTVTPNADGSFSHTITGEQIASSITAPAPPAKEKE